MFEKHKLLPKFDEIKSIDYVEYFVFNDKFDFDDLQLKTLKKEIEEFVSEISRDHVWHQDSFGLSVHNYDTCILDDSLAGRTAHKIPSHLYGITYFGENVEDEWYVVFLLYKISDYFRNTVVRVCDNDGEFLLIEAADRLPHWANPDKCDFRVFIQHATVKIIPPYLCSSQDQLFNESLEFFKNKSSSLYVNVGIQEEISRKIEDCEMKSAQSIHYTNVYLPIEAAKVLELNPQIISHAVRAFYNHDIVDINNYRQMKHFGPQTRAFASVKMTKCLYAMLNHKKHMPHQKQGWEIPLSSSRLHKAYLNGFKISFGLEIILSDYESSIGVDVAERDRNWSRFLDTLLSNSYFKNFAEDSESYKQRLHDAKTYFVEMSKRDKIAYKSATTIREILDGDKINDASRNWNFPKTIDDLPQDEDSDDFLNIGPQEFEDILQRKFGKHKTFSNSAVAVNENTLQTFLSKKSDFEGVENHDTSDQVQFDIDLFINSLKRNILDEPETDIPSSSEASSSDRESDGHSESDISEFKEYFKLMDEELKTTTMANSFANTEKTNEDSAENVVNNESDRVDVNTNMLNNFWQSMNFENGQIGPTSVFLSQLNSQNSK